MLSPAEVPATVSHLAGVPATEIAETHPDEQAEDIPDYVPEFLVHRMHVTRAVIYLDNNIANECIQARIIEASTSNFFRVIFGPEYRTYNIHVIGDLVGSNEAILEEFVPQGARYLVIENALVDVGPIAMQRYYEQLVNPLNPNVLIKD